MKWNLIKSLAFALLALAFLASCANAGPGPDGADQPGAPDSSETGVLARPPSEIEQIQTRYTSLMDQWEDGQLDSSSFTYSCNNEISGTVRYYSDRGSLRLVIHQYAEYDHHNAEDRYFVQDSALYFVYRQQTLWSFETENTTKDDVTEQRIYIAGGQPIRCLGKKFLVRSAASRDSAAGAAANRSVACASLDAVDKPFQNLLDHRFKPTSGCLDK